ncbi:hypothetical protein PSTG_02369 [Puccinia striiformis f. sp. tritici PST-78]|uniref:Uncharacterized protein n=1 Tax=Puccinia striiformis f. sp. tritici PST-78 TaxID=1165861 RepID=A0A0L0VYV2_9BASI|nr:hypothetical protein PSTG_02369 [Puccinia striiformis f. sp. tritici PST-78]
MVVPNWLVSVWFLMQSIIFLIFHDSVYHNASRPNVSAVFGWATSAYGAAETPSAATAVKAMEPENAARTRNQKGKSVLYAGKMTCDAKATWLGSKSNHTHE